MTRFPKNLLLQFSRYNSTIKSSSAVDLAAKVNTLYRRSTHPTSVPLNKLFSNNFPLSIKESLDDYSFRYNPEKFQHDLLALLPFYPDVENQTGRIAEVVQTPVDEDAEHFINEFVIYPSKEAMTAETDQLNHLVMVHGYGSGQGLFLKNFDPISSPFTNPNSKDWVIHAIDLLGYGCSSRPPFTPNTLDEVENWFHDSFEAWLIKRNIQKNKLFVAAHSMGAYLMATYGIKRDPNFCKKLAMISPGAVIKHRKQVDVPSYFAALWEQNISPFSLVRNAGPLGSKLVSGWSSRRFAKLTQKEREQLHKYCYGIFQLPGSGEYMLNFLLAPGADARHPLIERGIHALNCKMSWWYGKEDWMDKKGGQLCSNIINSYHNDPQRSSVVEIEDSGHHIYLDNIDAFNEKLINEMVSF